MGRSRFDHHLSFATGQFADSPGIEESLDIMPLSRFESNYCSFTHRVEQNLAIINPREKGNTTNRGNALRSLRHRNPNARVWNGWRTKYFCRL